MASTSKQNTFRVGLLVAVTFAVLMVFVFFIGSEQKVFAKKNEYDVNLDNATGLAEGNPVKISGVTVGVVRDIRLPRDPKQREVQIQLMVDRKYEERIRGDSRARLKKLGLLAGDSYIDITPGSPRFDVLEPGSIIPAQRQANVDQLISSGEDLVDNFVAISHSLKNILTRVDRGEGLLGEITSSPQTKQRLTDTFLTTLNKTNAALSHIERGRGVVGRLIYDDKYGAQLTDSISSSAASLQVVATSVQRSFESGSGALPALLSDAEGKRRVMELVENLRVTSENLAAFSTSMRSGEGVIPRLLNDKVYGDQALAEFTLLVQQLNETVRKINSGEGTAGKLVTDPSVYESINDILIGINESKLLRWIIRSRQQKGIEKRVEEQRKVPATASPLSSKVAPPIDTPPPDVPTTTTQTTTIAPADGGTTTVTTSTSVTSTQPPQPPE
ncbi:MAG TPA: MlaD family protein [Thermoanaerobaculia bacterium]|nr:MlaD family protein [Thermoanaerobaculia bacterium]